MPGRDARSPSLTLTRTGATVARRLRSAHEAATARILDKLSDMEQPKPLPAAPSRAERDRFVEFGKAAVHRHRRTYQMTYFVQTVSRIAIHWTSEEVSLID